MSHMYIGIHVKYKYLSVTIRIFVNIISEEDFGFSRAGEFPVIFSLFIRKIFYSTVNFMLHADVQYVDGVNSAVTLPNPVTEFCTVSHRLPIMALLMWLKN